MITGRLRHSVILQRQTSTKNELGEFVDTWTTLATRKVSIEPINGREYWQQSGEHAEVTTRIRLRYDASVSTLKPHDRVLHGDVVYDIHSVIRPRETALELVLMCARDE